MILRNHGLLPAQTQWQMLFILYMYLLQKACEIQIKAQSGGGELTPIPAQIWRILTDIEASDQRREW